MRIDLKLVLALSAVWFVWGSTFAGMHYAVATIPPFVMAGTRFFLAGAILYAVCFVRGRARVTRADLAHGAISGALLLLLGNGVTAYTVQYLPTGINSLIMSAAPVWMALIAFVWGGERPSRGALAGMALGLVGLGLLVGARTSGTIPLGPLLLSVGAAFSWALGSIYSRRAGNAGNVALTTALQMLVGGILLMLEAVVAGEWRSLDVHAISAASFAGLMWLIVFGSIVGYSAYQYTMHAASAALAATYAYVNPIVAVGLGYFLFGERLTALQCWASAIVIGGVALMLLPARRPSTVVADVDALALRG